jgi:hypothetical protein
MKKNIKKLEIFERGAEAFQKISGKWTESAPVFD